MEEVKVTNYHVQHETAIGCDVHRDTIVCTVLQHSPNGEWIETSNTFSTNYDKLNDFSAWCARFNPGVIVMESTGTYWMSPYDALEAARLPINIVNPAHVKRMDGRKTDMQDSRWLAQVGVNGSFIPSYIPTKVYRDLRGNYRNLVQQTESLQQYKNMETKFFTMAGYRLGVFSDQFGKLAMVAKAAILEGKSPEEVLAIVLKEQHFSGGRRLKATRKELLAAFHGNLSDYLKNAIESNRRIYTIIEEEVKKNAASLVDEVKKLDGEAFKLLQTIPGISQLSAAGILIEVGGSENLLRAFAHSGRFAAWIGLCPGNNNSANKRTGRKGRKGNKYLRRIFCEAAQGASRTKNSTLQSKYSSLTIRLGRKRSIVAIAHKLSKIVFYVLKHGTGYVDPAIDYEQISCKKNMPRWIKSMSKCANENELKQALRKMGILTDQQVQNPTDQQVQNSTEQQVQSSAANA